MGLSSVSFQTLMAVVTHSGGGIGFGAHLSFSSVVMNQKQLTGDEMAWFASIGSLAIPCGCLFVGWFMERFGRKAGLMCASVPCMIGWVLLSVSRAPNVVNGGMQIILMLVGRSFVGFGAGMNSVVGTIFVMEFSAKRLRGTLGGLSSVFISFGVLMMYAMGSFMTSWVKMASVCAVVHIVHVGAVFLMLHESPSWLVRNGRMFEAKRSLAFFRRLSLNEVKNELAAMISSTRPVVVVRSGEHDTDERPTDLSTDPAPSSSTSAPEDAINDTSDDPPTSVWKVLRETENWHQIVIMCCLFYFQQTAGGSVFIAFASDFVKRIGVPDDKLGGVTILMGVMPLLIVTMVCFLNAFVGRRFLLIASGSGMTLTTFGVGLHLLVCENEVISFPGYMLWYPVMLLTIYVMFCHLGFLPIPWLMIGEVFPPRCRGSAGGIVSSLANLMNFAVLALYPALVSHLATYYIYFFFSTMALMGTLLVIFFVKESRHISM